MCSTRILLTSAWHKMGTVSLWTLLPIQTSRSFTFFEMVFWDSSLIVLNSHVILKSAMTDSVRYCALGRVHQVSNLDHSSLIFKYCILWYSLNKEINFAEVSEHDCSLLDCLSCSTCHAFFGTIFGTGRGTKFLSPLRRTTFSKQSADTLMGFLSTQVLWIL